MARRAYNEFKNQLWTCIQSCPIVYINHFHALYVDETIREILADNGLSTDTIVEYDYGRDRIVRFGTKSLDNEMKSILGINTFLTAIIDNKIKDEESDNPVPKRLFFLKGMGYKSLTENENFLSLLQTFASKYEAGAYEYDTTIIIVSPERVETLPLSIRKFVTVLEIAPPVTDEIRELIKTMIGEKNYDNPRQKRAVEDMVRTLQGLQMYEVKQTLRTVLKLNNNRISDKAVRLALKEKKRIVKKSGIIEVVDTDISFDDVGGLQKLRQDLEVKSAIYNNLGDAEKYHIPIPKGILVIGMPGCGKSMIAQATANKFGVSLLRLDVSRLMGKYVGESEANLRLALATAEAAHPCVLWIDEIEKAFAGGNGKSGDNDMLVMRMMGHFLTWMQERKTPVYIVATANDVMRPEFMRKGRFDEVYFVDFPSENERAQILEVKIKKYTQDINNQLFDFSEIGDCRDVVKEMKGEYGGFSGSEIECVLNMVVETRFQDYLREKAKAANENFIPSQIKISKDDFKKAVDTIKSSVMANQKSKKKKEEDYLREKTSIERIKDMQSTYNFVNASNN